MTDLPATRPGNDGPPALRGRRTALVRLGAWAALACTSAARALPPPQGKVLLSVTGHLTQPNAAGRADFDLAMLDALPQHSFVTLTPWFSAPRKFSGPLLREVLAAAGASGSVLRAIALNDYKVEIPADDAERFPMLVATRLDDQPMTVRDKGPLFIVYPYDANPDLRSERYYSRSAWQLRTLEMR